MAGEADEADLAFLLRLVQSLDHTALPRQVLSFFLGFLGGVLWIIVTDAFFKVSDGFAETAADLGQLRGAENN
jgi:hypothetical protein